MLVLTATLVLLLVLLAAGILYWAMISVEEDSKLFKELFNNNKPKNEKQ